MPLILFLQWVKSYESRLKTLKTYGLERNEPSEGISKSTIKRFVSQWKAFEIDIFEMEVQKSGVIKLHFFLGVVPNGKESLGMISA